MKKSSIFKLVLAVVGVVVAVSATVTALLIAHDKKRKDDEELERYLDNTIQ